MANIQACDHCHERKVRCDKSVPCRRCRIAGTECRYTDRSKGRTFTQTHVDTLERKIKRLESQNAALVQQARGDSTSARAQISPASGSHESVTTTSNSATQHGWSADVAREVSYLSMNGSGERHYLGSSSGVLLANFIKANVDIESSSRPTTPPRDTQGASAAASGPDLGRDLPTETVARRLVFSYLNHDHLCYPVIQPAALLALHAEIHDTDRVYYAQHPNDAFIYDVVLAIATISISRSDWQGLPSAQSHYSRAMKRASRVLETGGFVGLQAVILLIQYRMSSSMQDTSASMWHLVGVGSRIALELGLHCESAYPLRHIQENEADGDVERERCLVRQEISRLCFWSIVCMDRIVSNILGRPLAIRTQDIDTSLPSDVCESILLLGLDPSANEQLVTKHRISVFLHITNYRLLCGDIIQTLHNRGKATQTDEILRTERENFASDLEDWRRHAVETARSITTGDRIATSSCFTSPTWFEMVYHNAMLMLYRPSPTLEIARDSAAMQTVFTSAQASIAAYATLHRLGVLNHSWITLQALFMTGLSYVYAVTMHCQVRRRPINHMSRGLLHTDPTMMEVVNDTRACSNVLVAVSERWKSLQRCVDVFNRLSDAILIDVIKFSPGSGPGSGSGSGSTTAQLNSDQSQQQSEPSETVSGPLSAGLEQPLMWNGQSFHPALGHGDMPSNPSPLAIENEFRDSVFDLQQMYNQQQVDMSVYQLSQVWSNSFGFPADMHEHLEHMSMDQQI